MKGQPKRAKDISEAVKQSEQTACEEWERYRRAKDLGHDKYLERAKKCDDFYLGEQWDPQDKAKLDRQGRPALTINQILPTVNTILGEQVTRRGDIRYKPAKDGTEALASVLTKTVQHIMDSEDYDSKESEVFADGIIQERGFFDVRIAFDDNLMGHVEISVDDPGDTIPDPHGKHYDPSTWTEVTSSRWWSLDEIEEEFGEEKRKRVEYIAMYENTMGPDSIKYEKSFAEDDHRSRVDMWTSSDASKRQIRSVRVLERQFFQPANCYYFVDPRTGDKKKVPGSWNEAKRKAFGAQFNLFVHKRREKKVRWRMVADKVLLHDEWSPYNFFTKIPYFPYFRRGKTLGVVTNLIDPQQLLNKLSSQELHVVNSVANSGWIVEKNSMTNMSTEELADSGSETGLVIEKKAGADAPEKIKPNSIPTGLDRIGSKAANNIREISGINEGMLGLTGSEISGVAIDSKEKRGQVQLQVPLDNLTRTRKLVAKQIYKLVKQFYTEPRVLNITRDLPREGEPGFEQLQINQPTPEGEILNNLSVGDYDVVVGSQPSRDTFNDTQFAEALELRGAGVLIPDDRIVEYSNLEKKHALAEEIRSMTGRGEMSPEEEQMAVMIQQMELATMQLNVAKLEGEVVKLRAEAQKIEAETGAIPAELEMQLAEMEMKAQIEREGFEVRAALALENSRSALEKIALTNRGKQTQKLLEAAVAPPQPSAHRA